MLYKVAVACALAASASALPVELDSSDVQKKWEAWKKEHKFEFTVEEEALKYGKFFATEQRIQEHNAKGLSWTMGHNKFSAMTPEEFKEQVVGNANMKRKGPFNFANLTATNNAASLDWVAKGAVTPVKDQAACGSCWAFSSTGSLEGAYQISTGTLKSFSEEQLVQCSSKEGNQGCQGGLMDDSFKFWETYPPVLESDYPYTSGSGTTGKCHGPKRAPAASTIGGFVDVKSESDLEAALNIGPVSVAIEADKSIFQSYKSGVITGRTCGTQLDHGVLAVGYGTSGSTAYWKVKNSWGQTWGMEGYVLLAKGTDECGIADGPPSYPTGVKAPSTGSEDIYGA